MARSADHNGGGAKRRTPSPGLAGLMWVSSVTGWQSDPEGEALGSGMGTRSRAAGLAFSGSIAGARGLNYRIEILRQVVIIRRGIGFSACFFFYLFFLFSCFFFPPLFPLHVALMDDLPLHLRWGEGTAGSLSWSVGIPRTGETADNRETGRTGKGGRDGGEGPAAAVGGLAGQAAAGQSCLGLSPTRWHINTQQNPESTNPPSHPHLLLCI